MDWDRLGANDGLDAPERVGADPPGQLVSLDRTSVLSGNILRITNLDRADPPGWSDGKYLREDAFNRNDLVLTTAPQMPRIQVECAVRGFDPAQVDTHILWCLRLRYLVARHRKEASKTYHRQVFKADSEWQGVARSARFELFNPDQDQVRTTFAHETVRGGVGLLMVAARLPGGTVLRDHVHVRIRGSNPDPLTVETTLHTLLSDRNPHIRTMLMAIFAHESGLEQFARSRFRAWTYKGVPYIGLSDPAAFPKVSFDFGIGVSQYTIVGGQTAWPELFWSWVENMKGAINLFLTDKLAPAYRAGLTWRQVAWKAWKAYNGNGAGAEDYADGLRDSTLGQTLPDERIGALDTAREFRPLGLVRDDYRPPPWPPEPR